MNDSQYNLLADEIILQIEEAIEEIKHINVGG